MKAPSPAFSFYPKDVQSDETCNAMTHAEFGMYMRLLMNCWTEGSIPSDPARLARLLRVSTRTLEASWPAIAPCFSDGEDGRLIQSRLESEREKQVSRSKENSLKGRMGGRPPKRNGINGTEKPGLSPGLTESKPIESLPSPSPFPSPSPKKNSVIKATSSKTPERISLEADHQIEEDRLSDNFRSIQESGLQIQPVLDSLPRSPSRSPFSAYRWLKGLGSGVPISKPGVTVLRLLNDAIEAYGRGQATPTASPKLRSNFYAIARITRAAAPLLQTVNPASIEGESL